MQKARVIALAAVFTLISPIGSGGMGTMAPFAMHVDRSLYVHAGAPGIDLGAVDARVLAATGARQD